MKQPRSTVSRARRALMRLALALPVGSWAADFGFRPPPDPDDASTAELMRDLAQRILPVYQEADTDVFLANVTALQIVSGAYRAAYDSSASLRSRRQGKPFDGLVERAILDGIYSRARAREADDRIAFADAYARSFQELVAPLGNAQAQAIMARLEIPPAVFREPLQQAFDLWRAKGSLPEADALALVRTWLSYQSRRSFGALLPELFAAENSSRYTAEAGIRIPVRGGVIHASVVRPGRATGPLPALLRFTLDPAEDDARSSAARGYVGVTAYVRGRTPDGKGAVWPFVRDGEDAAAVIDWVSRQAWSDGRVCMLGDGYSGYAAWAAARRRPAALKAIATISPMAPGIDFPMAGQIFRNAMVRWAQEHALAEPMPAGIAADANPDAAWQALDARWYQGRRPYWDVDRVLLGKRSRLIRTWLTHPSHDRYWQKFLPSAEQFARIDIPVLSFAGYYGADAGALYYHQEHLRHRPQADTTLLVGPYDAASIRNGTGPTLRDYTLDPTARVDLPELRYAWLDHILNGAGKPPLLADRVNYQVMGTDQWRHVPALNAPQANRLRLYSTPASATTRTACCPRPPGRWQRAARGRSRRPERRARPLAGRAAREAAAGAQQHQLRQRAIRGSDRDRRQPAGRVRHHAVAAGRGLRHLALRADGERRLPAAVRALRLPRQLCGPSRAPPAPAGRRTPAAAVHRRARDGMQDRGGQPHRAGDRDQQAARPAGQLRQRQGCEFGNHRGCPLAAARALARAQLRRDPGRPALSVTAPPGPCRPRCR